MISQRGDFASPQATTSLAPSILAAEISDVRRFQHPSGLLPGKVTVVFARELVGFVWDLLRHVLPPAADGYR